MYYAQYGEDRVLEHFFADTPTGYFVEAGALDGVYLSNTYMLAQKGWRGMLFEPDRRFYPALLNNRPESDCRPFALVDDPAISSVVLHESSAEALSTISGARAVDLLNDGYSVITYEVTAFTLDAVLDHAIAPQPDLVSLDTEGTTHQALRGMNLSRWRPRLLIVECFTDEEKQSVAQQMAEAGYSLAHVGHADNHFYCRDTQDVARLQEAVREAKYA